MHGENINGQVYESQSGRKFSSGEKTKKNCSRGVNMHLSCSRMFISNSFLASDLGDVGIGDMFRALRDDGRRGDFRLKKL